MIFPINTDPSAMPYFVLSSMAFRYLGAMAFTVVVVTRLASLPRYIKDSASFHI